MKLYFGAVPRRIDIELTSARPDGTWTWRAKGALEPRGALDASLLYSGAKAGDVVRAEADFGIEGITVVAVEPPRPPAPEDPDRIHLLERSAPAPVTTQLAGRPRFGPDRARPRRAGPGRSGPDEAVPSSTRGERGAPGPTDRRPGAGHTRRSAGSRPMDGAGPSHGHEDRGSTGGGPGPRAGADGQAYEEGVLSASSGARAAGAGEGGKERGAQGRGGDGRRAQDRDGERFANPADRVGRSRAERSDRPGARPGGPERAGAPGRSRRLAVGDAHRNAMLESLPVEQRPIAQQLLRGGIPAVRTALHFERERARDEGRPEPSTEGVLAIAESVVSRVKAAEWRDRAEAAVKAGDQLATRDLRSLVNGSETVRDEASRELVVTLREMLEHRVEAHRKAWAGEVARHLDEGQALRALRLSGRAPDPGARFSAELATRLRDAAGAALSSSAPPDKWVALLQAVVESPVRRTVKPEGLPVRAGPDLLDTARQQCGRVPGLAPLLGLHVPPPPGPARPVPVGKGPGRRPAR
ncbi:MAG: hypothetical protein ACRDZX_11350, partial [Acidimicrobiales bacterium]